MLKDVQVFIEAFFGPKKIRKKHRVLERDPYHLSTAIDRLKQDNDCEARTNRSSPLFILSAGWRSGSTFLQRLVMASQQRLIWGEPYEHSAVIQSMATQLTPFGDADWPLDSFMIDNYDTANLSSQWTACLFPKKLAFRKAHEAYFDSLFVQPAKEMGYDQWGLKEVRLGSGHAAYLKWLYPNAKFLFLVRNPVHAWSSYHNWRNWYFKWPDEIIMTPRAFGLIWAKLAEDFLLNHQRVGGLLLRYEDLKNPETITRLSEYLGTDIKPPDSLDWVRGAHQTDAWSPKVSQLVLARTVRRVSAQFGY